MARCPSCGATSYDLTTVDGRKDAAAKLRDLWRRSTQPVQPIKVAAVVGATGLVLAAVAAAPVVGMAAAALGIFGWAMIKAKRRPPVDTGDFPMFQIDVRVPKLLPARLSERTTFRGTVRMRKGIAAPLGGDEVVAFRIHGSTPDGPIDEGGAGLFEVEGADDHPVFVDGTAAMVDLAPGEMFDVELTKSLADYLHQRSPFRPKPPILLAEVLLRDGDEVEIVGSFTERAAPGGYRDGAWQKVMTGTPESPLLIRTPDAED